MDMNFLQKRIEERAQKRVEADIKAAHQSLRSNPVLVMLAFKKGDSRLKLISSMGYCPGTDLFGNADFKLLIEHTNFSEVVDALEKKYIAEETDLLLNSMKAVLDLAQSHQQ